MDFRKGRKYSRLLWLIAAGVTSLLALALVMESSPAEDGEGLVATYSRGCLAVAIPYRAPVAGAGRLTLELLDPEDRLIASAAHGTRAAEGKGRWNATIVLEKPLSIEDLVWHRLRYRFEYADGHSVPIEGVESVSEILRTPVVHILGQQSYLAGSRAAVRVIVTDNKNETLSGGGTLRIELLESDKKPRLLYTGALNRRGTTEAQFQLPAGLVGTFPLHYFVDTPIGSTEFTHQVRLEDRQSILLTTEKPLYQPGQTIHVRALALDRANHQAAKSRQLTFEVEDSRGNKVFKKARETDEFGIAFAEFALADEVNLGTYHIRALAGDAESGQGNTAELAVNIEKYVLPKFKVEFEFSGDGGKTKHGYLAGDLVSGTVRAHYFFGKPLEGAEVAIKASSLDVAQFEVVSVRGTTDKDGNFRFEFRLPGYFAGRPLEQGAARVLVEANVRDSAEHTETRGEPITVARAPILMTAIPEGGTLVRGLENEVFILTSYPDGSPAETELTVGETGGREQHVSTDAAGVAVVRFTPAAGRETLEVRARDGEGNSAETKIELQTRSGDDQVLLHLEKAVYRVGDRISLRVFSTRRRGTAYLDVVRSGQTILTRDVDLENGRAELSLAATTELAGTVDFNAYLFGRDAQPVRDHRLVFVQPADELHVEAVSDRPIYRPGEEARVRFRVTDARGEGVRAALGVEVVDEAVFALAEKQPGFAKVFFYLEQEVLKPRYEIHSIGMPEIVEPTEKSSWEERDRAARALFAATETIEANKFETEFGRTVPSAKYEEYARRYHAKFQDSARRFAKSLSQYCLAHDDAADLVAVSERMAKSGELNPRDAWGSKLSVQEISWDERATYYAVSSSGPDKLAGTEDDLAACLKLRRRRIVNVPQTVEHSRVQVTTEHDFSPFTWHGAIAGRVVDRTGAAVEGATVTARNVESGKTFTAGADSLGRFRLRSLPGGEYDLAVSMPGYESASASGLKIEARDRAMLSVVLRGEAAEAIVTVDDSFGTFGGGVLRRALAEDRLFEAAAGFGAGVGGKLGVVPIPKAALAQRLREEARKDAPLAAPMSTATLARDEAAPRVRSYFPEALYINPEIITDRDGRASIVIPLADSITTWRMAMMASTERGALGSGTASLKVFQDFFVDLDLPVTLTQGDRVSVPVAVYNYSGVPGDVALRLEPDDWYSLEGDVAEKTVGVKADRIGGAQFTLVARRIGKFKLTLAARMEGGASRADIVVREIEVVPNGREQNLVFNGRLEETVRHELAFPSSAIPEATKIFVKLYPGPLSQLIDGMESILRMPGGCFEQTSSSTYPNVLALDYMKRTKKLTPEIHARAEGFIANGYQRLLTFEVKGGGFSWFGNPPANKILTAYGLMEFYDMSKVYDVDPNLIARTQAWLAGEQLEDGSWKPDREFINEGATNRYNSDVLRITAYLAWSLQNTGYRGEAVERAKQYIEKHLGGKLDSYTLAVLANFAVDYGKDREFTREVMGRLIDARIEKGEDAYWSAEETAVYATGESASVETTGLATQAVLKWGGAPNVARKALHYIASKKDASGNWGTTQATIMALRALLLATEKGAADVRGTVEILVNGEPREKLVLTEENNELLHQFVYKNVEQKGSNTIALRFSGKGGLAYQIVGRYFLPWDEKPENEPLTIDVGYDRTELAQNDIARATVTVRNNLPKAANLVMVDLGIPPGFELMSEDLEDFRLKGAGRKGARLEKYSLTATQAILYFDSLAPGEAVKFQYRLRAKYPIRAKTFASRVYEYYDPDVKSVARPVVLEVRGNSQL